MKQQWGEQTVLNPPARETTWECSSYLSKGGAINHRLRTFLFQVLNDLGYYHFWQKKISKIPPPKKQVAVHVHRLWPLKISLRCLKNDTCCVFQSLHIFTFPQICQKNLKILFFPKKKNGHKKKKNNHHSGYSCSGFQETRSKEMKYKSWALKLSRSKTLKAKITSSKPQCQGNPSCPPQSYPPQE